jgi:hypothetical protein
MGMVDELDRGRESFRRREWRDAYTQLSAADREAPLGLDDLEMLAAAASLAGDDPASADAWIRAHQEYMRAGNPTRAVRWRFGSAGPGNSRVVGPMMITRPSPNTLTCGTSPRCPASAANPPSVTIRTTAE